MTPEQTTQICTLIDAAWPNNKLTRETRFLIGQIMQPIDYQIAKSGIMALMRTHKWAPSISELIEACEPPRRSGYEAWGEVSIMVRRVGRYAEPRFSDPLLARAVELFGWAAICDSRNEEADRAHFSRLYDDLSRRGVEVTGADRQLAGGPVLALAAGIGRAL